MTSPVVFDLPENLTIASTEALHEQLEPLSNGSADVVFNASAVSRADTAGLQLLYSFLKTLKSHDASLSWSAPSSVLIDTAEQLGLKQHLALD